MDLLIDLKRECSCHGDKLVKLEGKYINGPIESSIIFLDESYNEYITRYEQSDRYAPRQRRNLRMALKLGYRCREFRWNDYLNDIYAINTSKEIRSGGPMREAYRVLPEQLKRETEFKKSCLYHWPMGWGIFKDGLLTGYITSKRAGDILLYSQIIGHGDHLSKSIMVLLHFTMREWVHTSKWCEGLKFLMYGDHYGGRNDGLRNWKERFLFTPWRLIC